MAEGGGQKRPEAGNAAADPAPGRSGWEAQLEDLASRRRAARAMGGPEKLARRGLRWNARERVARLCDEGSFRELGTLAGALPRKGRPGTPADALVAGIGAVDGRPVLVGAEDFTVRGGSIGLATHAKRVRLAELAAQERAPLVMLLEGAGERASNALERYPFAPNDLQALAALSGVAPTVAVVMGPSAGHGALTAPLMDLVVMVEGASLFAAGPPVVEAATGERVTAEELGGAALHARESGLAHAVVPDDASSLALVRRYLGYLPSNAWQRPPRAVGAVDTGERRLDGILELLPPDPRRPWDGRALVEMLVDRGSALELQPDYGASLLTVLARLGGDPVALVASQPLVRAGAIDREAAEKAERFLRVVGSFHLPVVFLADTPGVMAGRASERSGVLRSAARMFAAQSALRAPKLHVTLRKAYGFGSSLMAMNPFDRQTLTLAFPGVSLGAMPASGAGAASQAGEAEREGLARAEAGGVWSAADAMAYDEVIDPRELRDALLAGLRLARSREWEPVSPRPR